MERPPHNPPLELTSFVGREREITEVKRLLADHRLLTLTGPGGSAKSRLAQRAAADLARGFADGASWVELAALSDPDLVPKRVASVIGVPEAPGRQISDLLVEHLVAKEVLLVLDNCEHLVGACAELADTLLHACPDVHLLATSREPLGMTGEVSWSVPPLPLPDPQHERAPDELFWCGAVRLFVERAKAVAPGFNLTEENAPAVAAVCARLDRMPLGIELAAAKVRVLSPAQILERLDDRFRLLRGGGTASPRHRRFAAARRPFRPPAPPRGGGFAARR